MESTIINIKQILSTYGLSVVYALLIFFIGRIVSKIASSSVQKGILKTKVDITLARFLSKLIYFTLLAVFLIAALNQLGIQTTSIVAVLATAGLAVGLALKDSLSNFAAGFMIIFFKPFIVGNYVEAGGTSGTVDEIGLFTVTMKTPDNKKIIVPNSSIINGNITNFTSSETRRVDLTVGVSYTSDIKKTKEVLFDIINNIEAVRQDPAPVVVLSELADSSINFTIRAWTKTDDYWPTFFSLNELIKTRFDEEGIEIPFPQMDVHLKKES